MRTIIALFICIALAIHGCAALPSALQYTKGQELHFQLSSQINSHGETISSNYVGEGTVSHMTGVVALKCVDIKDGKFLFVMNMFNVEVGVNGKATSRVAARGSQSIGADMYFSQSPDGTIHDVWHQKDDSPFYVNIKLGAINAFQTRVGLNAKATESDPVGIHTSAFVATPDTNNVVITKTFSQDDVTSFTDAKLSKDNVKLTAKSTHNVHAAGYIQSAIVEQSVVLYNANQGPASMKSKFASPSDAGFNMNIASAGLLTITLGPRVAELVTFVDPSHTFSTLSSAPANYAQSTLVDLGRIAASASEVSAATGGLDEDSAAELLTSALLEFSTVTPADTIATLSKLAKYFSVQPLAESHVDIAREALVETAAPLESARRLFFILANIDNELNAEKADLLLIQLGITSPSESVAVAALNAIAGSAAARDVSISIVDAIISIADSANVFRTAVGRNALLALGSVASRTTSNEAAELLSSLVDRVRLFNMEMSSEAALLLDAIANAGEPVIASSVILRNEFINHPHENVRKAVLRVFANYPVHEYAPVLSRFIGREKNSAIRRMAVELFARASDIPRADLEQFMLSSAFDGAMPFNKSFDKSYTFGGDMLGATFSADLFAGTNFDCNQPTFNYEVSSDLLASFSLLKRSQKALEFNGIYGKVNGNVVGNSMKLLVWDKVVWDKTIPTVDCSVHRYPLFQAAPGWHSTYTVWVSVIPITFTAGVDLVVNVDWSWQICDASLLAQVDLIPKASLVASAAAQSDLLVIQGGVDLAASINVQLQPTAFIHGSQCQVGFNMQLITDPMSASFNGWYKTRKCKFLIFDCHWSETKTATFWSWALPAKSESVLDKTWSIARV